MRVNEIGKDSTMNPSKQDSNNRWLLFVGITIVAVSYWKIINFLFGLV